MKRIKFLIIGLVIGLLVGLWCGVNIGKGHSIFSNPFAKQDIKAKASELFKDTKRAIRDKLED